MAKTIPCEGAIRCRGKVVGKCYGCDRAALCAPAKDGLCVPYQKGEEPERGEEEELVKDPNVVSIEQCAQCLLPVGTAIGDFSLSGLEGRREVVTPLINEEVGGGVTGHTSNAPWPKCAMGRLLAGPPCKGMLGLGCRRGAFLWCQRECMEEW